MRDREKKKKFFGGSLSLSLSLLLSLVFLSGCVYLRLLEIKKQLKSFDENFAVGGEREFLLRHKKPILTQKDMRFLIGAGPLSRSVRDGERVWDYEFEQARSAGTAAAPMEKLSLRLRFRDQKLVQADVPETFLLLLPREVLLETLKQAAHADVLQTRRTARARVHLEPPAAALLPDREKTLSLLGPPLEAETDGGLETLLYRYRIVGDKRDTPIRARFSFSADGLLRRVVVTWDTSTVDAEFLRPDGAPQ